MNRFIWYCNICRVIDRGRNICKGKGRDRHIDIKTDRLIERYILWFLIQIEREKEYYTSLHHCQHTLQSILPVGLNKVTYTSHLSLLLFLYASDKLWPISIVVSDWNASFAKLPYASFTL